MILGPLAYDRMKFEEMYAKNSGTTVAALHVQGMYAYPCQCGDESCKGWAMLSKESAEDNRKLGKIRPGYHIDLRGQKDEGEITGVYLVGGPAGNFTLDAALTNAEEHVWNEQHAIMWPLIITMPCGKEVGYEKREDFPKETVPCPCGNPRHKMVVIDGLKVQP